VPLPGQLLAQLIDVVGATQVLTDPGQLASFTTDWSGRFVGHTDVVVRPSNSDEVGAVLDLCRGAGVALVPQGGNTGLVGGGVPMHGEAVLSLSRLGHFELDATAGQITVGAGVTIGAVQRAAAEAGWAYGVDLGSRDSATVGGTVSTNAGGLRVLRYGDTRAQLLGLEAVLGTGDVVRNVSGLRRDNTGYQLASLFCGAEGTLGFVTAACLRLVAPSPEQVVALVAFEGVIEAANAASLLRREAASLSAVEFFVSTGLELVCQVMGLAAPFAQSHPAYLLVEGQGQGDVVGELAGALQALAGVVDVAVATETPRRAELWRYREAHTEAINTLGAPHKLDVALPPERLGEFLRTVGATVTESAPEAKTWLFGHAGDGSVHVNLTGLAPDDEAADDAVLTLVAELGGSISAEHGIGTAKVGWLARTKAPGSLAAFATLKRAFDPDGVCNPHVLMPPA
jgi:FAD/FMN-containing dehydrogenase